MATCKLLLGIFNILGLAAYVAASTWTTYNGSHCDYLIFPNGIPYDVNDIQMDNNLIEAVDNRDLNYTSLVRLNLSHNLISKLSREPFINVKRLELLDLSYNKISGSDLTTKTFKKLESLKELILKGNPLGIIKYEVFLPTYFSAVQYSMDFSECSIHTIQNNSLAYLDKLTRLDLSRNNVSELPPGTFLGLLSLQLLNLSHNSLSRVSTSMFNYLNVSVIDLSSNKISILEDGCFNEIKDLKTLDLSDNRLAIQPKDQFGDRLLAEIDLSKNLFETFDPHLLSQRVRQHLRVLRITNSAKLKRIVAGKGNNGSAEGFENLEKLYLNDNVALTNIDPAAFSSSSKTLRVAHMTNTMLEEIRKDMLEWMKMTNYSLSSTNLKCDCHAKWMLDGTQFDQRKAQLKCITPPYYRSMSLFHLSREHLVCPKNKPLMFFGAITTIVLLVTVMVLLAYWLRHNKPCPGCGRRHRKHGKYVSVYSKDVDEPVTRIVDDKTVLVEAVDV